MLAALDLADDAGVRLSLVPLFETIDDLRAAPGIVDELLGSPASPGSSRSGAAGWR